jgi:hypothetical protein
MSVPVELSRKIVTARKPHACWICGAGAIEVGQKYERTAQAFDGTVWVLISCTECAAVFDDVYEWVGGYDYEGIDADSFDEWARENPDDKRAIALLARIHGVTA